MHRWSRHRFWMEPVLFSLGFLSVAALFFLPPWLRSGSGMQFAHPWVLFGLLLVPLVLWRGIRSRNDSGRMMHPLARVISSKRGWRTWIGPVSVGLRILVITLIILSLARPQDATRRSEVNVEGIDLMLVLDLSGSMAIPDMPPTRLAVAKDVILEFVAGRKNDRIGAIVFAENAYTLSPLTLDYGILSQMISELSLGVISEKATAIGNAVGLAVSRLRESTAKSRGIVLLTDGASNAGNVAPEQAAAFAKLLGIRVYTILVGRDGHGEQVNPDLLIEMAEQTGGQHFRAVDRRELSTSFHRILDQLERSILQDEGVMYAEVFPRYLLLAMLLALLDLSLTLFVMRRTP